MKTYRHPQTKIVKTVDGKNPVQEAALKKLGYEEITAETIESEPGLSVTYQQVTPAVQPKEPPALPHLTPPAPTAPAKTGGAITREDTEPLGKTDKK